MLPAFAFTFIPLGRPARNTSTAWLAASSRRWNGVCEGAELLAWGGAFFPRHDASVSRVVAMGFAGRFRAFVFFVFRAAPLRMPYSRGVSLDAHSGVGR